MGKDDDQAFVMMKPTTIGGRLLTVGLADCQSTSYLCNRDTFILW